MTKDNAKVSNCEFEVGVGSSLLMFHSHTRNVSAARLFHDVIRDKVTARRSSDPELYSLVLLCPCRALSGHVFSLVSQRRKPKS